MNQTAHPLRSGDSPPFDCHPPFIFLWRTSPSLQARDPRRRGGFSWRSVSRALFASRNGKKHHITIWPFLLAISEIGRTFFKKSAAWSPAYINETTTPTIFVKQVPMSPRENSLSGGVPSSQISCRVHGGNAALCSRRPRKINTAALSVPLKLIKFCGTKTQISLIQGAQAPRRAGFGLFCPANHAKNATKAAFLPEFCFPRKINSPPPGINQVSQAGRPA